MKFVSLRHIARGFQPSVDLMERRRLVSVIVPTRDRPALLRKALAGIRAVEGPDLAFEILVGDNGTVPDTASVVAEFGGEYLPTARQGPASAQNVGLDRASGEFIAFLDDDDEWLPGNVRPHIAILDANPEIAAVFGQIVLAEDRTPIGDPWPAKWPTDACEDWDWQLRIAQVHRIAFVDRPCTYTRVRPGGSFDDVQVMRAKLAARVFRRHALPSLTRWPSLLAFARSYFGVVTHFYDCFVAAAIARASVGSYSGARRAVFQAFRFNPSRALKMMRSAEFKEQL
jgi:glycosyltransferase involved in cell wall biosynthesis